MTRSLERGLTSALWHGCWRLRFCSFLNLYNYLAKLGLDEKDLSKVSKLLEAINGQPFPEFQSFNVEPADFRPALCWSLNVTS